MAGNKIRGVTIQLGGDASGLTKALEDVNKEIGTTQRDLKDVERLLKLDPTNTELLAQKQRYLATAVEATKKKIEALREAEKKLSEAEGTEENRRAMDALRRESVSAEIALKDLENEGEDLNDTIAEIAFTATRAADTVEDLGAEIKSAQKQLDKINGEFSSTEDEAKGAEKALKDLGDEAEKTGSIFSDVFKADLIAEGAKSLVEGMKEISDESKELALDLSKLDQNAREHGVEIDAVRDAYRGLAAQTMETDSAIEATSNLLQAGFTESNLQKAIEGLSGAALRFPDTLKIESLADSLQETISTGEATGQFAELLERLGLDLDDFNAQMESAIDSTDRQNIALQTLADQGLNDTYQEWLKNNEAIVESNEATLSLQEQLAELGEVMMPIFTAITEAVAGVVEWFNSLDDKTQRIILVAIALVAAIGPVTSAFSAMSGIIGALSNPVGLAVAAIGAIIAALVLLWEHADEIGAFFKKLFTETIPNALDKAKGFFVDTFNAIVEGIKAPINGMIELLNGFIGGINFLIDGINSIKIDLPDWLPDWLGGGQTIGLNIGQVPEIPLLAKGGILSQGSAIVGEAGPELLTMSAGRAIVQPLSGTTNNAYSTANTINVNVNGIRQLDEVVRWYTNQRQTLRAGG